MFKQYAAVKQLNNNEYSKLPISFAASAGDSTLYGDEKSLDSEKNEGKFFLLAIVTTGTPCVSCRKCANNKL
jgi:hypothetical protein